MLDHPKSLTLRGGQSVRLPRLVPSFSSKGFPQYEDDDGNTYSDASKPLVATLPALKDSFLVSAYDLSYKNLKYGPELFDNTEVIFIDSGQYELSSDYDSTEPVWSPYLRRDFGVDDYRSVLAGLPHDRPLVIASPDQETAGMAIEDQIAYSQRFFAEFPNFTRNFILKPEARKDGKPRKYLEIDKVLPNLKDLRAFDILGVTEKELGDSLKKRLVAVGRLRAALDRENIALPIHIWGGLDPVITPLYFFAGADIFDGLSWLRYAYYNGMSVYRDAWQILSPEAGVESPYSHALPQVWFKNLGVLSRLTSSLRMFRNSGSTDFSRFEWHGDEFQRAYDTLTTEIPELHGGS